jgi:hypothetical protein
MDNGDRRRHSNIRIAVELLKSKKARSTRAFILMSAKLF